MARQLIAVLVAIVLLERSHAIQQTGLFVDWLVSEQQATAKPLAYSEELSTERQMLDVCLQEVFDRNCQCTNFVEGTGHCLHMYVE